MSATGEPSQPGPVQNDPSECSCSSTAVTSVFVTLLVLLIIEAALYVLWKIYWRGKKGQHLVLVTDSEKGDLYAYDNPGFKEGPASLVPALEKESPNKAKWALWAGGLVPNGNVKVKAMDDSYTSGPVVRIVPLRSRDFTGLGFNICGNMRDGVFIKDVLHRGPASESGHIYPGDRLESVKVCLKHVVLEDALTILSYASPYDVELGVSSPSGNISSRHPPAPRSIVHPFYKSHSISDLQMIEKSSSSRSGEKSDLDNSKLSTLEKKSKQEAERYQNTKNCIIESVQKQENIFHTIDLDETDRKESSSPSNMKAMLVKGIQNLKEKLHNTLHQDEEKGSSGNTSRSSTLDKRMDPSLKTNKDEGFKSVDLSVPEDRESIKVLPFGGEIETEEVERKRKGKAPVPPQVESNGPLPATNGESVECIDSDSETVQSGRIELDSSHVTVHQAEGEGRKASSLGDLSRYEGDKLTVLERAVSLDLADGSGGRKRKAPQPPQELTPYKEVEPAQTGTLKKSNVWGTLEDALRGSDSESEMDESSHISPDISPMKPYLTSSTPMKMSDADISSDPSFSHSTLSQTETVISVESASIPEPVSSLTISNEPKVEIHMVLAETDQSVSTPFNLAETEPKSFTITDISPPSDHPIELNHQSQITQIEFSPPTVNGNSRATSSSGGSTPPLPTSPVPEFVTEIKILTDRLNNTNTMEGTLDSLQLSYLTCCEMNPSESPTYKPISFEPPEPILNGSSLDKNEDNISLKKVLNSFDDSHESISKSFTSLIEESEIPKRLKSYEVSLDDLESPKKIMSTFKNDSVAVKRTLDFSPNDSYRIPDTNKENDKPLSAFETYKIESKKLREDGETSFANKILKAEVPEKKFSIVEIETEPNATSSAQVEITKPPRNVSVTSIKTSTSRIPVRAGQRSPGSGKHSPELRRMSDSRNGHHSP